jgi:hypothetical protein
VRKGEEDTVSRLLDTDAFDEYIEQNGGELLPGCPHLDIADMLIRNGASVNAVCKDCKTMLNKVALLRDAKMMYLLLDYGATRWNRCLDRRIFFKRLFANSLLNPLLSGMFKSF